MILVRRSRVRNEIHRFFELLLPAPMYYYFLIGLLKNLLAEKERISLKSFNTSPLNQEEHLCYL
jgi:hypothetical protein